jgi:hypothetical protein
LLPFFCQEKKGSGGAMHIFIAKRCMCKALKTILFNLVNRTYIGVGKIYYNAIERISVLNKKALCMMTKGF